MRQEDLATRLGEKIRNVPDFPKPGIQFKDITTLLADGAAFREATQWMAGLARAKRVDRVAAVEARGFIFGAALARELNTGFAPIRKPRKLPYKTIAESYSLEYGTDSVEMHVDAVKPGESVLLVDDLLATGGTMLAACRLVERQKASVAACVFLIELAFLKGRDKLSPRETHALIRVDSE
ncbi:MAG: adenine phosphoribosyltransferase [Planctomycetes bacterium]|nr:adenine phosphoribosyltransferase [Planctomycetota bacterium]